MFIKRNITGKQKNGKVYCSYRLLSSYREGTKVKTRTILNLGASFDFPKELWSRLSSRIETILYGQDLLVPEEDSIEYYAQILASRIRATDFRLPEKKPMMNLMNMKMVEST
jgi:hypothetical protein